MHDHVDVGDQRVDRVSVQDVALPVHRLRPPAFGGVEGPPGHSDDLLDVGMGLERLDRRDPDFPPGRPGDCHAKCHGDCCSRLEQGQNVDGSAGKFGGAESDVEVVQPVTGETHEDQAGSLQPVRHAQSADVERPQAKACDELRNGRLGVRVVAGEEHVRRLPPLLQDVTEDGVEAFTTLAPGGATLATSWAIEVSSGMASPSASELNGLLMSTITLSDSASPYWVTTGTTSAYLRATMTMSPVGGTAPKSPVVTLAPRVCARSAAWPDRGQ